MQTNVRVEASREKLSALPLDKIDKLCKVLIDELADYHTSSYEKDALRALTEGDYDKAKQYCLTDPCNSFLAAISCLASARRSPLVADSVLRDAARHTAEASKIAIQKRIADRFSSIILQ